MYYIFIEDNKLNGCGECQILNDGFFNLEVSEELYNSYKENPDMYTYQGGEIVIDPDYEEKQKEKEAIRIAHLNLTGADVERGLYQALNMDFNDVIAKIEELQPTGIDIKALKIELKANNFYRGNPYIDAVGKVLGLTKEQLDKFFADGNYEHLLPIEGKTEDNGTGQASDASSNSPVILNERLDENTTGTEE